MVDGNPAQLAYVADQNQVNRIYYRYFRQARNLSVSDFVFIF